MLIFSIPQQYYSYVVSVGLLGPQATSLMPDRHFSEPLSLHLQQEQTGSSLRMNDYEILKIGNNKFKQMKFRDKFIMVARFLDNNEGQFLYIAIFLKD